MSSVKELVERLHRVLVEEIRARRPQYLQQPFTVAEIYQDLVPYRSHRDRIGAAMNGDYEHALLQLLAGEGGFLVLDSEPARRRLMDELQSSNPNTGIFRDYAAVDVRLNPAQIPSPRPPASSQADGDAAVEVPPVRASVPVGKPPVGPAQSVAAPPPRAPATRSEPAAAAAVKPPVAPASARPRVAPSNCRSCKAELPGRQGLRFCPFCGKDVNLVPCAKCGEELEPGWRFCIVCGAQVPTGG